MLRKRTFRSISGFDNEGVAHTYSSDELSLRLLNVSELADLHDVKAVSIEVTEFETTNLAAVQATLESLSCTTGNFNTIETSSLTVFTTATVHTANIDTATVATATITDASITTAHITTATIQHETVQNATISTATITNAEITNATIEQASINSETVTTSSIENATVAALHNALAEIEEAIIDTAVVETATITDADITAATIETETVQTANINVAVIQSATIPALNTSYADIGNLEANNANLDSLNSSELQLMRYQGAFDNTLQYAMYDVVKYENSAYICIATPTVGVSPSVSANWYELTSALKWQGTFISGQSYLPGSLVYYQGSTWLVLQDPTSIIPPADPSNPIYFALFAQKGADGIIGKDGIVWKGPWSTDALYNVDDVVLYKGGLYICIEEILVPYGNPTPDLATLYWQVFLPTPWVWKGNFVSGQSYNPGDLVFWGGSTWLVLKDPMEDLLVLNDPNGDPEYFAMVAQKGDQGPRGERGPKGDGPSDGDDGGAGFLTGVGSVVAAGAGAAAGSALAISWASMKSSLIDAGFQTFDTMLEGLQEMGDDWDVNRKLRYQDADVNYYTTWWKGGIQVHTISGTVFFKVFSNLLGGSKEIEIGDDSTEVKLRAERATIHGNNTDIIASDSGYLDLKARHCRIIASTPSNWNPLDPLVFPPPEGWPPTTYRFYHDEMSVSGKPFHLVTENYKFTSLAHSVTSAQLEGIFFDSAIGPSLSTRVDNAALDIENIEAEFEETGRIGILETWFDTSADNAENPLESTNAIQTKVNALVDEFISPFGRVTTLEQWFDTTNDSADPNQPTNAIQTRVQALRNEFEIPGGRIPAAEDAISDLQGRVTQNETDIGLHNNRIVAVEHWFDTTNDLPELPNLPTNAIQTRVQALRDEFEADGRVTVAESEIDDLQGRVTQNETDIGLHNNRIVAVEHWFDTTNDLPELPNLPTNAIQTRVQGLWDEFDEGGRVATLESQMIQRSNRIRVLEDEFDPEGRVYILENTTIPALDTRLTDAETAIDALQIESGNSTRLDTAEANIVALQAEFEAGGRVALVESDVATLQTDVDTAQQNITALQDSATLLTNRVTTAESEIELLESEFQEFGRVTALEERLTTAEDNITNLSTDVQNLQQNVSDIQLAATALSDRVTTAEQSLTTAAQNISDIQLAATALSDRVTTAEQNLTTAAQNISDIQSAATALTNRVTTAEQSLITAEQNISDIQSAATILTDRVTAAEQDIAAVQQENANQATEIADLNAETAKLAGNNTFSGTNTFSNTVYSNGQLHVSGGIYGPTPITPNTNIIDVYATTRRNSYFHYAIERKMVLAYMFIDFYRPYPILCSMRLLPVADDDEYWVLEPGVRIEIFDQANYVSMQQTMDNTNGKYPAVYEKTVGKNDGGSCRVYYYNYPVEIGFIS